MPLDHKLDHESRGDMAADQGDAADTGEKNLEDSMMEVVEAQKRILDQWCFAEHYEPHVLLQVKFAPCAFFCVVGKQVIHLHPMGEGDHIVCQICSLLAEHYKPRVLLLVKLNALCCHLLSDGEMVCASSPLDEADSTACKTCVLLGRTL